MNDRQRFEFAGRPERCLACGSIMRVFETKTMTQIVCPQYHGGPPHEFYRFNNDEPGLGSPALLWSVGGAAPAKRMAIYSTIAFGVILAIVLLVTRLFT